MLLTRVQPKCNLNLSTVQTARTIVFIDRQIPDSQQLIEGILPGIKVIQLDSQKDGIQEITEILRNYSQVSTIHIISHGAPGCLYLGNTRLSLDTLAKYAEDLQSWFSTSSKLEVPLLKTDLGGLTEEKLPLLKTDVLSSTLILYGCNVAARDTGEEFIEKLHQLTRAEIAASTTKIGHVTQGGNWNFEVKTSEFEVPEIFTPTILKNWQGILANISGQAFLDFNNNGVRDGENTTVGIDDEQEVGVDAITVTAFAPDGTQIDTTTTNSDGTYTLTVPDNTSIRLEFSNIVDPLVNTSLVEPPASGDTVSNVAFIDVGSTDVTANLGLYQPSDFTDRNNPPRLVTTCYVFSDNNSTNDDNEPAIVTLGYTASGRTGDGTNDKADVVTIGDIGATYGLAHSSEADDLFVGAFQKRHSDIGPGGNDAIYRIDLDNSNDVTQFINLDDVVGIADAAGPYSHGVAGQNPGDDGIDFISDERAFATVGKVALGDIEISEDRQFIYTINLFDRRLYKIPIGDPSSADATVRTTPDDYDDPTGADAARIAQIQSFDLIAGLNSADGIDFSGSAVADDVRPFGLAVRNGLVYIGFVDSAESTQLVDDLDASVYTFDPETETFSTAPVISFPLNYDRELKTGFGVNQPANWSPWKDTFADLDITSEGTSKGWVDDTQPILSDIAFDGNGDMVLGFRDRTGDQIGPNTPDLSGDFGGFNDGYEAASGGDILRATFNGDGTWIIESPHVVPGNDPTGEFYGGERFGNSHRETAQGGLTQVPGYSSVATIAMDPERVNSGGLIQLDNSDGSQPRSVEVYAQNSFDPVDAFNKANGLGDLEYLSQLPPTTVFGDRIWNDLNGNGIQDAGEPGLAGITLTLFDSDGNQVDLNGDGVIDENDEVVTIEDNPTTPKDESGQFLIAVATTGAGSLVPGEDYEIRVVQATPPLVNFTISPPNQGTNEAIDSDATVDIATTPGTPFVQVEFTAGDFGQNNYNLDIGFTSTDYGDAPDTYGTVLASDGARHGINSDLSLGTVAPDAEIDGFGNSPTPNDLANLDDTLSTLAPPPVVSDEDAIDLSTIPTLSVNDTEYTLTILVTNTSGNAANLVGWIDFDGDGTFEENEGTIVTNITSSGDQTLTWNTTNSPGISDIVGGISYARFRLSTDPSLTIATPTGFVTDGEVEDFQITITEPLDFGDAPTSYGTPSHGINLGLQINDGTQPDVDSETGLQSPNDGSGDDNDGNDDEETSFTILSTDNASNDYSVTVPIINTVADATLVGWIDFNQNGSFEANEGTTVSVSNADNSATLTWNQANSPEIVNIQAGETFARLRLSTDPLTTADFDSVATDGEVEDYAITVLAPPTVDLDGDNDGTDFTTPFNGTPVAIGNNVQVADPDSPNISQAVITLTNSLDGTEESLDIDPANLPDGMTATISDDGTTITLSGDVPPADYQTAIEAITYNNTATNPDTSPRTIEVQVTDPDGLSSNTAQTTITLAPTDFGDAPTSYGTPSHGINLGLQINDGTQPDVDSETGLQSPNDGSGDDNDGNDDEETSFTILSTDNASNDYSVTVPIINTVADATLVGWIDFNQNGSFEANEGTTVSVSNADNSATLTWNQANSPEIVNIQAGETFARLRLSTDPLTTADFDSVATDGEVEDYAITVLAPPTVDLDGDNDGTDFTTAFEGIPVAIGNNVEVTDPDSPNISQAVITLTNSLDGTEESLDIDPANLPDGMTATISDDGTTITLSGDVPPADYQTAIEAITYNNTATNPDTSPRTIEVQVTDPDGLSSNTAQTTITLAPTDFGDAPTSYGTPSHGINLGLQINDGTQPDVDSETGLQSPNDGSGDDNDGNDDEETSFTILSTDNASNDYSVTVPIINTVADATLVGWIDFNQNGSFEANEGTTVSVSNADNSATLTWNQANSPEIVNIQAGETFARLRLSTDPLTTADFDSVATDGEVEDYAITVLAPPTVDLDGDNDGTDFTTPFNGTPVAIGNNVQVADPDSPNISQAVITLTNSLDGTEESLDIDPANLPDGMTATISDDGTTITLSGDVPPADYQTAIEAITYSNTTTIPDETPRTITVQVTDPDSLISNIAQTTITLAPTDFGDAPASFGNPSHSINQNLGLGTAEIDAEIAPQPTPNADGDDLNGTTPDDEDAFTTLTPLAVNATSYSLTVPVENMTGNPATLVGWVDFDGDGAYQADEGVSATINDGDTTANLTWDATTAPGFSEITTGTSYVRFRISTDPLTTGDFEGTATNGEVEDYSLIIGAPPTVDLDGDNDGTDFTTPFNGTPVAIGNNVQVADPDSPNISQAVITLTNPQDGTAETLNINPDDLPPGISIISNDGITIVLGGNATPETYATVIESITYSNTTTIPDETPRTITVQVTDPDSLISNIAQTTITLAPTDFGDAPASFGNPSHSINQNLGLGTAEIDAEIAPQPTPNADGDDINGTTPDDEDAFTTLPNLTTNASSYSVDVPVTNSIGAEATLIGWIDFNGDGTFAVDEAVSTTVADGTTTATLTWDATNSPGFGNITPGVSFARFRISTDSNLTATNAAPDGEVEDYTINIINIGQPPVAVDDSAITPINVPVFLNILEDDFDPNGDPVSLTRIIQNPNNGTVEINDNGTPTDPTDDFTIYTPSLDFVGEDSFEYEISNPEGLTDTALVTIIVRPARTIVVDDFDSTPIDTPRDIPVLNNDIQPPGGGLQIIDFSTLSDNGGTIVLDDNGTPDDPSDDFLTYTPPIGFQGEDTFTYTVESPDGTQEIGNVTVNVSNTNPLAAPDRTTTLPSTPVPIEVLLNDTDPNGLPLRIVEFTRPTSGTVSQIDENGNPSPTGTQFLYTPNDGFVDTDTFTYIIENGTGQRSLTTVNITIVSDNNPPVAEDNFFTGARNIILFINPLENDSDPDGDPLTIIDINTEGTEGQIELSDIGLRYIPALDFTGVDTFTYTISDGRGGTDTATVTITIPNEAPINNPPVANNNQVTTQVDQAITISVLDNDTDPDGDSLSISEFDLNSENGGTISQENNQLIYTPPEGFIGTDIFTYTISDGNGGFDSATVTIIISAVIEPIPQDCPDCEDPPNPDPISIAIAPAPPETTLPLRPTSETNTIVGTEGNDFLEGTEQADQIDGLGGSDILIALEENDTLLSGTGNDGSLGSEGDDLIYGDPGNDFLKGDVGNDTLIGGITGTPIDELDPDFDLLQGDEGDDLLAGTRGDDTLNGGQGNDLILAGQGDDNALAELGNDTLNGEQGDDFLLGGTSNAPDVPQDTEGQDLLFGGDGNDTLFGNQNNDTLVGNDGNDELHGGRDNDLVDGNEGDDVLFGELGNDTLVGGPSGDTPLGDSGDQDNIRGNEGDDVLVGNLGNDTLNGGEQDDDVRGGKDDDLVLGELGNDTLLGEQGDDTIFGGTFNDADDQTRDVNGQDLIFGGSGNDFIEASEGDDQVIAGEGDDTAFGGQDNDFLWGGDGEDFLLGDNGNDTLCGNEGNDTLRGDPIDDGDSPAVGDNGQQDLMYGGVGNDVLFGDEGNDSLCGNEDDDTLFAGKDNDIAWGGEGDDVLFGDEGNDTLVGGLGSDTMTGGDGDDLFVVFGNETANVIEDFQLEQDQIVLGDSLTFEQLTLLDDGNGNTIISLNDQLLITVNGVAADNLTSEQFLSF